MAQAGVDALCERLSNFFLNAVQAKRRGSLAFSLTR